MRIVLALALAATAAGCWHVEPSRREASTEDWNVPANRYDHIVSKPLKYEELPDYVDAMVGSGWEVISTESAGPEFPSCYMVVVRRFQ